jgi:hypothetical protein
MCAALQDFYPMIGMRLLELLRQRHSIAGQIHCLERHRLGTEGAGKGIESGDAQGFTGLGSSYHALAHVCSDCQLKLGQTQRRVPFADLSFEKIPPISQKIAWYRRKRRLEF